MGDHSDGDGDDAISKLKAEVIELARATSSKSGSNELLKAKSYGCAIRSHLQRTCRMLLDKYKHSPISYSYQSDATSHRVAVRFSADNASGCKVRRGGKVLEEYLMERAYFKAVAPSGECEHAIMTRAPRPLTYGKGSWFLFSAYCDFWPMLKANGHIGPSISHFAADRLAFSSGMNKINARHAAWRAHSDDGHHEFMALLDLVVGTGCCLHDVGNALKWGISCLTTGTEVKDLHIGIESLRNSAPFVICKVGKFWTDFVDFDQHEINMEETTAFWSALGIPSDLVEQVASINPMWKDGRLSVSAALSNNPDWMSELSWVCIVIFAWKQFSDSRWVGSGSACRAYIASVAIGVEQLVSMARDDPNCSDYYVHGFNHLTEKTKFLAVVDGMVSHLAEELQLELMQDDRVVRNLDKLEDICRTECDWLASLPMYVWNRLAAIIGSSYTGASVRSQTLTSAHGICAYVKKQIFDVAHSLPWSLCQGNVHNNIIALRDADGVESEHVAAQIQALARLGYSIRLLEQTIMLMGDLHWSTKGVEGQHGSTAVLHKFHPDLSGQSLSDWAFIHMTRALFKSVPDMEYKLRERIDRAMAENPWKVCGTHVFCRASLKRQSLARQRVSSCTQRRGRGWSGSTTACSSSCRSQCKKTTTGRQNLWLPDVLKTRQAKFLSWRAPLHFTCSEQGRRHSNMDAPTGLPSTSLEQMPCTCWYQGMRLSVTWLGCHQTLCIDFKHLLHQCQHNRKHCSGLMCQYCSSLVTTASHG